MSQQPVIGWIGLGAMGNPMVRHLLTAGYTVHVHDLDPARVRALVAAGAIPQPDAASVARHAEQVFSTVPGDAALVELVTGADGVLAASPRRLSVFADLSTVTPQASAAVARPLQQAGIDYLRIPVSGTVTLAESARLRAYASGPREAFEQVLPLLRHLSVHQEWVGPGEEARVVKLVVNTVLYLGTAVLGEALGIADAAGVDRQAVLRALGSSVVGSDHFRGKADKIAARDWSPVGALTLAVKDLDMALATAGERAAAMPLAQQVRAQLAGVEEQALPATDIAVLADIPALAQLGGPEAARRRILAADDARYAAMLAGDLDTLADLLADELMYCHSTADVETRPQYLASLASGRVKYRSARRMGEAIHLLPGLALMTGLSVVQAEVGGIERELRNRFTTTWIQRGGRWQLLSWASTPLKPAQP
ncbi:MAG: DUF4440 domain-containing protein [Rhodoferax sp.]|nr:DUF4440 domain-containing protein [Rhodoferax sp.]